MTGECFLQKRNTGLCKSEKKTNKKTQQKDKKTKKQEQKKTHQITYSEKVILIPVVSGPLC